MSPAAPQACLSDPELERMRSGRLSIGESSSFQIHIEDCLSCKSRYEAVCKDEGPFKYLRQARKTQETIAETLAATMPAEAQMPRPVSAEETLVQASSTDRTLADTVGLSVAVAPSLKIPGYQIVRELGRAIGRTSCRGRV